jgi:hypothetical protein
MRLASFVPGELIPLPLSGSVPELPHVAEVADEGGAGSLILFLKRSVVSRRIVRATYALV